MANIINAITSGAGGLSTTADASGIINLQSGGTTVAAVSSTGLDVTGAFTVNGSPISVSGGATTTSSATDVTLTSSSNRVQNITLTAVKKSVILPDATTLSSGGPTFIINNTGNFAFYVKSNGGGIVYFLSPKQSLQLSVTDITTAQGKWATQYGPKQFLQYEPSQPDGSNILGAYNFKYTTYIQAIQLTSTTMLLVFGRSNGSIYGVVATNSSGTLSYGTVTQIYNGATNAAVLFIAVGLSSTAAMLTVDYGTTTLAVGITISGTTVSGSTASATFGVGTSNIYGLTWTAFDIVPMSATEALLVYGTSATTIATRNLIHNGASAPTLGTASAAITASSQAFDRNSVCMTPITATTAQLFYQTTNGTVVSTRIITISGSSAPTLGTAITMTWTSQSIGTCFAGTYSSTESWWYMSTNADMVGTVYPIAVSFTISGTTITIQKAKRSSSQSWAFLGMGYNLSKIDSTNYIAFDYNFGYLNKYTYVSGDTINSTGTSEQSIMSSGYASGISGGQYFATATTGNPPWTGGLPYTTTSIGMDMTSTIIPGKPTGIQMFSGSTTTALVVGQGVLASSATNFTANTIAMVQVITLL
jgi:hypothetical protein